MAYRPILKEDFNKNTKIHAEANQFGFPQIRVSLLCFLQTNLIFPPLGELTPVGQIVPARPRAQQIYHTSYVCRNPKPTSVALAGESLKIAKNLRNAAVGGSRGMQHAHQHVFFLAQTHHILVVLKCTAQNVSHIQTDPNKSSMIHVEKDQICSKFL